MSKNVEKVAKAIAAVTGDDPESPYAVGDTIQPLWKWKLGEARAAIDAMISPLELAANPDQCLANLVRARFESA